MVKFELPKTPTVEHLGNTLWVSPAGARLAVWLWAGVRAGSSSSVWYFPERQQYRISQ